MADTNTATTTPRLERETCGRCGGTGHHSYCSAYGTTCFQCGGRKERLTKRGAAAMEFLKALRSRRADQLKVGDRVHVHGKTWGTVTEVRRHDLARDGGVVGGPEYALTVNTTTCGFPGVLPERLFQVLLSKEEQLATLEQAVAYQNTLTKAGTPRK